jgi:hypothetical protein
MMNETVVCLCLCVRVCGGGIRPCRRMQRKGNLSSPRGYGLKTGVGVPGGAGGDTVVIIGKNAWAVARRVRGSAHVNLGFVRAREYLSCVCARLRVRVRVFVCMRVRVLVRV